MIHFLVRYILAEMFFHVVQVKLAQFRYTIECVWLHSVDRSTERARAKLKPLLRILFAVLFLKLLLIARFFVKTSLVIAVSNYINFF